MHIAICDDNVADRKQLERLLKRESDKRATTTGILYADSFGNAAALLANPMQYNVFYIDMCKTDDTNGVEIANALIAKGVHAPIVMCCSDMNYREHSFPDNVIFLDKPIRVNELSDSIDHALEIMSHAESLIELRENTDTIYVTEPDILYAVENGPILTVTLTDGRQINIATSAINFYSQVEHYPAFVAPSFKTVLNCRYIQKLFMRKATMTDGATFAIHKECMPYTKRMMAEFSNQNNPSV